MLRQQRVHDLRRISEIRGLRLCKGRREINEPAAGGKVKHTERTSYGQAMPTGDLDARTIVIRIRSAPIDVASAIAARSPSSKIEPIVSLPLKPRRLMRHKGAHWRRRIGVRQLIVHRSRHQNLLK